MSRWRKGTLFHHTDFLPPNLLAKGCGTVLSIGLENSKWKTLVYFKWWCLIQVIGPVVVGGAKVLAPGCVPVPSELSAQLPPQGSNLLLLQARGWEVSDVLQSQGVSALTPAM